MKSATGEIDAPSAGGGPEADLVDKDVMYAASLASGACGLVRSCAYYMFLFILCLPDKEITGGMD